MATRRDDERPRTTWAARLRGALAAIAAVGLALGGLQAATATGAVAHAATPEDAEDDQARERAEAKAREEAEAKARAKAEAKARAKAEAEADRAYSKAVRYARSRKYASAVEWFEKTLPVRRLDSDLYYNLVNVAAAAGLWGKAHLYATGFLFLEPDGPDSKEIRQRKAQAAKRLAKAGTPVAEVIFRLEPKGVEISVDHVPVSRADGRSVALAPGEYQATSTREDHEPWEEAVTVAPGAPRVIEGELPRMLFTGFLKIATTPADGVKIFVNEALVGETPLGKPLKLETRKHLIRFERPGYERWVRYVTIERDATELLEATLEKTR